MGVGGGGGMGEGCGARGGCPGSMQREMEAAGPVSPWWLCRRVVGAAP